MQYLFILLALVFLLLCTSACRTTWANSTWAPLQSDQVREICSHMTAEERNRATERSAKFGLILGGLFCVTGFLGIPIGIWLFDSYLTAVLIIMPVVWLLVYIALWKYKPMIDKSNREFLASTRWSLEQRLTSENIVLRKHWA
jgi:hypothetical protein